MCIAAPGKVIEVKDKMAIVLYPGNEKRKAMIMDIKPEIGSFVLVQMGIIVEKISKSQALTAEKAWIT
jgi:hydrogenase assembly chaperone HypC/HupF